MATGCEASTALFECYVPSHCALQYLFKDIRTLASMARVLFSVIVFLAHLESSSQQAYPIQLQQSSTNHGPDGPWHAVSVELGSPGQVIDLLPGGIFQSQILTRYACQDQSDPCGSAGLFNPEGSSSLHQGNISFAKIGPGGDASTTSSWTNGALLYSSTNASSVTDTLALHDGVSTKKVTVNDFDIYMWSNIQVVNPDGSQYPLQIGQLALGNVSPNQTFTFSSGPSINGTLVPNNLKEQSIIDSSSFGLHYGSAPLGIDLSLWLGGYDQLRALAPVSAQQFGDGNTFLINLYDIGIGVAAGQSPFIDAPSQGLLASENDTLSDSYHGSFQVLINPVAPYLNLPNSTCKAIAKYLPVTYNAKYGLYLWNISDPQYTNIVTSPAYLSFSFPLNGGPNNFTINVPFQLLNLTLESPLMAEPTQYFPCQPPQDPATQTYSLGRAFLQAAFFGANWDEGHHWYLAQAPGPGVSPNPNSSPIKGLSGFAPGPGDSDTWADTWNKTWKVTPDAASATAIPPPASSKGGLSGGAIAGVAIGAVSGVAAVLAIGWLLYRRRQQATKAEPIAYVPDPDKVDPSQPFGERTHNYSNSGFAPSELGHENAVLGPSELSGGERFEMQHPPDRPSELVGSRAEVVP